MSARKSLLWILWHFHIPANNPKAPHSDTLNLPTSVPLNQSTNQPFQTPHHVLGRNPSDDHRFRKLPWCGTREDYGSGHVRPYRPHRGIQIPRGQKRMGCVCEGVSFQSQMSRSRLTPCLFTPLPLGSPEAVAKFKCLSFLHRAPVLKGLAVFVEKEKSGSTTVLLDLGKMNPREFYSVCLVAGHPPILIKPHVDNVGNILKSHFDIAFGLDFFKTRIQDVFDDEILVKELVRRLLENSRLHCSSHLHYLAPPSPRSTHCASFSPAASASHHNGLFDQGISRSR